MSEGTDERLDRIASAVVRATQYLKGKDLKALKAILIEVADSILVEEKPKKAKGKG